MVNPGDFEETFSLEVTSDTGSIGTRAISLAPQDSKTEIFNWNTTETVPSNYTINAETLLARDEIMTNNFANTSILIKPCVGWIEGYVLNNETSLPISGAMISIDTYSTPTNLLGYYNIEIVSPNTCNVTATADGYYNETKLGIFIDDLTNVNMNFSLKPTPLHQEIYTT